MIPYITTMKGAFDLTGKNAIVTGGNGGIGLGIAKALAECGANVGIFCRNMDKAKTALEQLSEIGGKHKAYPCDVLKLDSIKEAANAFNADFGDIDILINNSGVGTGGRFLDQDENLTDWHFCIDTDLSGVAHVTYVVGNIMRKQGKGGSIVNISSNAALTVNKGFGLSAYAAAKAGVNQLTKSLAYEFGEFDVRINAICPGFTRAGFGENPAQAMLDLVAAQQPLPRMGEAIEMGALAVFLVSPASAHITGEIIAVDGGYTLAT